MREVAVLADSQGVCRACGEGKFKGAPGAWNTQCAYHTGCAPGYFSDPATEVLTNTEDRQCTKHRAACDAGEYLDTSEPASLVRDIMCHSVSAACDGVNKWESASPTSISDRECVAFSDPCVQDESWEITSPSAGADRACKPVTVCDPGSHFMSAAPTVHSDTVCSEFRECATEQIIVKPSSATKDTRFPGIPQHTEDRTCRERVACEEFFQAVKFSNAYQHQCEDISANTYTMSITGFTSAEAHAQLKEEWQVLLADKADGGVDATMNADVEGFASTRDFKVKSVIIQGSDNLTLAIQVVFGASGMRTRRARTRVGRGSGGSLGDVEKLPEGATPCADNSDDLCCIAGYGSSGNAGSPCAACGLREYSDGETAVSDAPGGCLLQPACGLEQEPPTYYSSVDMSTTELAADNCETLTSCSARGLLVSKQPTDAADRECGGDVVLCSANQYWSDAAQFDASDQEWTTNPTCAPMETCALGTFWANADAWTTALPLYQPSKDYIAQRNCVARQACGAGQYLANPSQVASEGTNSIVNNDCVAWTACTDEQYQTMQPSTNANRICVGLTVCKVNQYQIKEETSTSDRGCADVEVCPEGQYLTKAASSTANRECTMWEECNADLEYQCTEPSGLVNRQCCEIKECTGEEVQTVAPTATSNRVCATFACEGLYVRYETLSSAYTTRLRMCNSRWTSCASEELQADPVCHP